MKSHTVTLRQVSAPVFILFLLAAVPIQDASPWAVLWTAPLIMTAAMLIAWAAESAQFFIAQGFALAILAWLQTLPEFAVEAVLAWKQQVPLLLANLTGALRLLTGLGWPLIYVTAAIFHRRRERRPLRAIHLEDEHCVEVLALVACMAYIAVVCWKRALSPIDALILLAIYVAYLLVLSRIPPKDAEGVEDLELIPRTIVQASRPNRIAAIAALFLGGGAIIYFMAEPFLGSLLAASTALGMPSFLFVQWVAPFVSEFPEKVSAINWARTVKHAPMALMNMVSSNINQWTLLTAMLSIVFSLSRGEPSDIPFDDQQMVELLMTLGQSLVGTMFLLNLQLAWWEAAALFVLWAVQFGFSTMTPGPGLWGAIVRDIHWNVTIVYYIWGAVEIVRMAAGRRKPEAFIKFAAIWKKHVRRAER
jgi:cation:H+ antiporter